MAVSYTSGIYAQECQREARTGVFMTAVVHLSARKKAIVTSGIW